MEVTSANPFVSARGRTGSRELLGGCSNILSNMDLLCGLCPGLGHISGNSWAMKQNCNSTDCLTLRPAGIIWLCLYLFSLRNQVGPPLLPLGNGSWSVLTPDLHLGIGWGALNGSDQKLCQRLQLCFNGEEKTHFSREGFGRFPLPVVTSTLFSPTHQALFNASCTSPPKTFHL